MSKEGKQITGELRRKYGIAESIIADSDKKYLFSVSASDKIQLAAQLADMYFILAISRGKNSLKELLSRMEFERNEKIKNYVRMIKWLKTKQD
jgi:hypothetical protein